MRLSRTARRIIAAFSDTGAQKRFSARRANDEAEIYLYDSIGDGFGGVTAKDFAAALKDLKGAKALSIRVNSPGGDVQEAVAIYNLIRDFRGESTVKIDGVAASAASVLAMAGDKITTAKSAMWMIHEPWALVAGSASDLRGAAEALDKAKGVIVDIYQRRTGGDAKAIAGWMEAETWMTADEAKERGFTDEIYGDDDQDEDDDEEEKKKESALSPFAPRCYALIDKFKHPPTDLKDRGPSSARLAHARALALRIRNSRPLEGARQEN